MKYNAEEAIALLRHLIATPSFSREEDATASILYEWLSERGASPQRFKNNVWAMAGEYDPSKPTLIPTTTLCALRLHIPAILLSPLWRMIIFMVSDQMMRVHRW